MKLDLTEQVRDELVGDCEVKMVRQVHTHVVLHYEFDFFIEILRVEMAETFMTLQHVLLQEFIKASPKPQ